MARYGVTYEEVDSVATELLHQGKNPTQTLIRQTLGRGSATTISRHCQEWRERRAKLADVNDGIFSKVDTQKAVSEVWGKLTTEAQEKFVQIKEEHEAKTGALNKIIQQLEQEKQAANQTVEKASQKINHLETDIQLLRKELLQEHQLREVETVRANKSEEFADKLQSETKSHIADLKQINETNLAEIREQREKDKADFRADLTQYKDLLENQRVSFMMKLDELNTAKSLAEKQLVISEADLKRQQELTQSWMEKARALEVDLTITKEQINTLSQGTNTEYAGDQTR